MSKHKLNKKVIYTVVCGQYDEVNEVLHPVEDVDYICFVDSKYKGEIPKPWIKNYISNSDFHGKNLNRYYKINVCKILKQYIYSIYVDGNICILNNPFEHFLTKVESGYIGLYKHNLRKNILEEAKVCSQLGLVYKWEVDKQVESYINDGFVSDELFEANVIFRKHCPDVDDAMNIWWGEYINGVKRDQISFTYSMYKSKLEVVSLGISDVRKVKAYFDIKHHEYPKMLSIKKRIVSFINRAYCWI